MRFDDWILEYIWFWLALHKIQNCALQKQKNIQIPQNVPLRQTIDVNIDFCQKFSNLLFVIAWSFGSRIYDSHEN